MHENARMLLIKRVTTESKVTTKLYVCASVTITDCPAYAIGSVERDTRIGKPKNVKFQPGKLMPKRGLYYGRERRELNYRHDILCDQASTSRRARYSFRSQS